LVFFYSKNQTDYRLTFIAKWSDIDLETGEFIKGETKPKRFTYLLGGNESCTTAAQRILELARKPFALPQMNINPDVKTIFDFKFEDFTLVNYQSHPHIKGEISV
jgi:hypothetical protein